MTLQNVPPDLTTYSILLKSCIRFHNFQLRKLVHRKVIRSGLELDSVVLNTLISLYSKCGDAATARLIFEGMENTRDLVSWSAMGSGDLGSGYKVFEKMPERNLGTWTLMITRFAQLGCARDAIELFLDMELSGHALDRFTYSSVLSASTESGLLAQGKQLHSQVIRLGLASDVCVGCSLVDMYAKCTADGSVDDLRKVFDRMPEHNVMSWTAIITAYVQIGECDKEAIELFCKMISGRVQPNHFSFSSVLKACGNLSDPYKHALREMEKFIR
ncbi:Pentatricopeptide repeat-containing protein, chloroplastic [Vitis vinifera]|uniref:Pentatricopeptide repeat-containing protein, chloroplastic n=1 Tax=Vitis vinifera TaxID=29760 RepID=A0A438C516_VITVI|nr:Pentatricopeptide repeat-containing protein, chloroplastic [Vitis vinifera]